MTILDLSLDQSGTERTEVEFDFTDGQKITVDEPCFGESFTAFRVDLVSDSLARLRIATNSKMILDDPIDLVENFTCEPVEDALGDF